MITRFGMSTTPPRSRAPNLKLEDQTSESGKRRDTWFHESRTSSRKEWKYEDEFLALENSYNSIQFSIFVMGQRVVVLRTPLLLTACNAYDMATSSSSLAVTIILLVFLLALVWLLRLGKRESYLPPPLVPIYPN
uniref:Uncharacterized protein n=1 Tax=Moniliophthora roreri TaxID=221103 RepID=A0A0W0GCG8_MONRR